MQGEATEPRRLAILNARRMPCLMKFISAKSSLTALITCVMKSKNPHRKNKSKNRNKNTLLISINAVSRVKFL